MITDLRVAFPFVFNLAARAWKSLLREPLVWAFSRTTSLMLCKIKGWWRLVAGFAVLDLRSRCRSGHSVGITLI